MNLLAMCASGKSIHDNKSIDESVVQIRLIYAAALHCFKGFAHWLHKYIFVKNIKLRKCYEKGLNGFYLSKWKQLAVNIVFSKIVTQKYFDI